MKTLFYTIVCVGLLSIDPVDARLLGASMSEGTIKNFDEKTVTLVDDEGKAFSVPRSKLEGKYKIQPGVRVTVFEKITAPPKPAPRP